MKVLVLNMRGQPLMPCSPPKSRVLLKEKQAVVVNGTPFAIQLTIATGELMQAFSPEEEAAYEMLSLALSKKTGEKKAAEANRSPKRPVGAKSGALRNRRKRYRARNHNRKGGKE